MENPALTVARTLPAVADPVAEYMQHSVDAVVVHNLVVRAVLTAAVELGCALAAQKPYPLQRRQLPTS